MSIENIILGVLSWKPCSGYDIQTEVEYKGRNMGWGRVGYGSIYPKLKRMEIEGLIYTYHSEEGGRKTNVYELTEKGWRALSNWLIKPPAYPVTRDELFMKLSFWETGLPEARTTLIEHLKLRYGESLSMLKHYNNWERNGFSSISEFGALGIAYVKERLQLELKWIDGAIKQLEGEEKPPVQDPNNLIAKAKERRKIIFESMNKDQKK
ncbi:PadR family transcriptional regulator [Bacillus sp. V33-4]|uniref:PadR family transcriptional regulator n=1 Tax=Bacillus sp. V33-4 TaxID=2054169 RepID=UPI0015E0AE03|nr:PadR family transcriptional regulator [Bacillus sp. V33-4]